MSEHLAAAAAAVGGPEELVERSARARAAAQGVDYEEILAAWAGGTAAPAPAAAAATEPAPVADEQPETPAPAAEDSAAGGTAAPAAAPAAAASPAPAAVGAPTAPATVSPRDALDYDAVTTVATVGIKERTATSVPTWLTTIFVMLPVAAIIYFISFSTGPNCGAGGQLAVDRQTGVAENCDGTEFARGGAAGGVDVRAIIATGSEAYSANCASCHGANGGGGVGPQLSGGAVVNTFASCLDHEEWVSLGSAGFQAAGNSTYGDSGKTINGGMPGFASLSPEELTAVVLFERVNFGGANADEAVIDCGLVQPADGETTDTTAVEALG